ncbi:hypothetical protein PHLCEN_2v13177 [Hermanssonia centrifuga]|uniref:Potassium channel domain-containing protein n=1 Tax=Hermanssonia centrifuga TaxID=98765 RepID=A0A2R6NEZ7_9APHY|nr:hypothetical protein PHLCEN_2v13177 [Hermanssonia centrifuga]
MSDSIPLTRSGTPHRLPHSRASSPRHDPLPHVISFENADAIAKDIHPRWKRDLYLLVEQPTSSASAFLIHILTTSLIVISATVTVLETIPSSHAVSGSIWFGLETSLVALFTVEYIARVVAHSNTWASFAKWSISITTVGYGEITPRSFLGRLITVPLLVFGLLLIALPTFVLGREFSMVWDLMKEHQASEEEEEELPTPLASPILRRNRNRSSWDMRLDSLAAEAMMPLSAVNRRHAQRDRAELASQLNDLRATVETQGEMLRRMMEILDEKGKQRAVRENEPNNGWS